MKAGPSGPAQDVGVREASLLPFYAAHEVRQGPGWRLVKARAPQVPTNTGEDVRVRVVGSRRRPEQRRPVITFNFKVG